MNWIKENKFLAGFLGVLLLGVLGGGWLTWSAYGKYDETSQTFEKEAREYNRLRTLKPYPDQKNLAELKNAKDGFAASIMSLQKTLAALVLPNEELKTQEFQDRLNKTVLAVRTRAAKVAPSTPAPAALGAVAVAPLKLLPDRFYLDFDRYQNELPRTEMAATALNRQLKALEFVANELIDAKIDALTLFKRGALPEESGSPAPPPPRASGGKGRGSAPGPAAPLVVKHTLEIGFVSDPTAFRRVLNTLSSTKKQFFIVRSLQVRNLETKGPSRGGLEDAPPAPEPPPGAPPADPVPPTPTQSSTPEILLAQAAPARPVPPAGVVKGTVPAAPAAAPGALPAAAPEAQPPLAPPKYIVGEEKIVVIIKLEIVDFPVVQIK